MQEEWSDLISKIEKLVENNPIRSETETKSKIIRPILESLGWSFTGDEVQLEYPVSIATQDYYVDYALLIDENPVAFVEAKALKNNLSQKDARQIIDYCKHEEVKWGILTNGKEIRIYNTKWSRKPKDAFFEKISLSQFKERKNILDKISKESIKLGEIEKYAEDRRKAKKEEPKSEKREEPRKSGESFNKKSEPKRGKYAGKCPMCGSKLVWRKSDKTGEIYRGCTNFSGGCRWNDRSH